MEIGIKTSKISTCIIIPCYNEEHNFPIDEYNTFLNNHSDVLLCFVNDGSVDNTYTILKTIKNKYPKIVDVINIKTNSGKASAVRKGMHYCNETYNYSYIGYLDADLSASILECIQLRYFLDDTIYFAFGSRIMKIGSVVERNYKRFLIGRVLATIISKDLKIRVYDTQCGCKLFTRELAIKIFKDQFISKWLFDVEIFHRIIKIYGRDLAIKKMIEVPLKKWVDEGNSAVKKSYFFKLWFDLYRINKVYSVKPSQHILNAKTINQHV